MELHLFWTGPVDGDQTDDLLPVDDDGGPVLA
jgi:hypothetical protein